ncbi:hypothetical protein PS15p_205401 [Mucor circinelloides]
MVYHPECAQVAADTFGRPIAEYTSEVFQGAGCRTFLPLLEFMSGPNKIKPGKTPLPLILQNQDQMHWFTVIYKKPHKLTYPTPAHWHNSEAMEKMELRGDKGRSFWNRHLSFVKEKHAQQSGKHLNFELYKCTVLWQTHSNQISLIQIRILSSSILIQKITTRTFLFYLTALSYICISPLFRSFL